MAAKYLIQGTTGRIYMHTDTLAQQDGMFPCDKDGKIIPQKFVAEKAPDEMVIVDTSKLEGEIGSKEPEQGKTTVTQEGMGYDISMPIDQMNPEQCRAALMAEFGQNPHHATGLEKLRVLLNDLRSSKG